MRDEDLSTARITSLATLERAIAEIGSLFSHATPAIWRGHGNVAWPLRAEVFRPLHDSHHYDELALTQAFLAQAESRHRRCPPHGDVVGWLMLARQGGLPTRLLDWTHNPLVALYFAALPDPDDEPEADAVAAVRMREVDHRVLTQQGCYTIHQDGKDLTETDYRYVVDPLQPNPVWRRAFVVPRTHKRHLLDLLAAIGIQRSTLFLDLETLSDDLKRSVPRLASEMAAGF